MSPVGRLRDHIDHWKVCGANEFVLKILEKVTGFLLKK